MSKWIELVVGNLDEKREWRKLTKRVKQLPKDYRYAYKKMLHYFNMIGYDMTTLIHLIELLEESAAMKKPIVDIIGHDPASFCEELLRSSEADHLKMRKKLNQEILAHCKPEVK